jgi:hypothetical protein
MAGASVCRAHRAMLPLDVCVKTACIPCVLQLEKRGLKVLGFTEDNVRQLQKAYDVEWERDRVELEKRYG